MLAIHILAGLIALAAGAVALYARKGASLHRRSGLAFTVAMLVLTSSAVIVTALVRPPANPVNLMAATLTFYLVCTGVLAVRLRVEQMRGLSVGFMLLGLASSLFAFGLAVAASNSADGKIGHVPAPPLVMFATVGLIGWIGDARMLVAGRIEGARRLARHLWRMSFAMLIATMSFFLGQARQFPEPIRKSGLLTLPVLLVLGTMIYWLVRVPLRRRVAQSIQGPFPAA